jgi:hypothetical protein
VGAHACKWQKSSGTWTATDIHPSGYSVSLVNDVQGSTGVGMAMVNNYGHAYMWNLGSQSGQDLNPTIAEDSEAFAQWNGRQGGAVRWGTTSDYTAIVWLGSRDSYVDMNPDGVISSSIQAMASYDDYCISGGAVNHHAAFWSGFNRNSFTDVNPVGYFSSQINAIKVVDGTVYAVGTGVTQAMYGQQLEDHSEALLWTYTPEPLPEPSSLAALAGGLVAILGMRRRRA